jgi:hypothetical protein
MSSNNFLLWLVGAFSKQFSAIKFLQLAYVELGHTSRALINLVANWAGHIELHYSGAFGTSSIHSARLSCRSYKSFSSSATHTQTKNPLPFYKLRCTNLIAYLSLLLVSMVVIVPPMMQSVPTLSCYNRKYEA